jgi:RNA-binding protein YhbY
MEGELLEKGLRAEAQRLRATVHVGKKGLTLSVIKEIELQLKKNGMVKIKFNLAGAELDELLSSVHDAKMVMKIGRTVVLRRENYAGRQTD